MRPIAPDNPNDEFVVLDVRQGNKSRAKVKQIVKAVNMKKGSRFIPNK